MKVALYHPWIHAKGGAERVILEYLKRTKHDVTVFTNHYNRSKTYEEFKDFSIIELSGGNIEGFVRRGMIGIKALVTRIKSLHEFDALIISTGGVSELIVGRNKKLPTVLYCHTPLRVAHNLYTETLLSYKNPLKRAAFRFSVFSYKILERMAWKKIDSVFANSETVRQRIVKAGLRHKDEIRVLYPGADLERFKISKTHEKYFFAPGRLKQYKRFDLAIKAFEEFSKRHKGFRLVIAGSADDEKYTKHLRSIAPESVEIRTSVSEKEMAKLYESCFAVLFTAKDEDWGIVPLEAMACGKPVISVNEGGPTEYIKSGYNGILAEADYKSIAKAMAALAEDKAMLERIRKHSRITVEKFSWDELAQNLDKEIERLAK